MLPTLAAIGALGLAANILFSPSREAARGVQLTCQEKYCEPLYQIHVDKPVNTLMRDDRPWVPVNQRGNPSKFGLATATPALTLKAAYDLSKQRYYEEAHTHPGVRLVAHTLS
jgi:hypothetical protein